MPVVYSWLYSWKYTAQAILRCSRRGLTKVASWILIRRSHNRGFVRSVSTVSLSLVGLASFFIRSVNIPKLIDSVSFFVCSVNNTRLVGSAMFLVHSVSTLTLVGLGSTGGQEAISMD